MRVRQLLQWPAVAAGCIGACAATAEFESPPTLRASDVLEPVLLAGPHFTVGDAVLIPPGAWHQIRALDGRLRFLCCCAPPYRHEDTFFE